MTAKAMTKAQLATAMAEEMSVDRKTANAALDTLSAIVMREVSAGGSVMLPGIGKVMCRARPERQVRNPATGETMTKEADRAVKVTIAKALKDAVND
jgi:DNA-binding protein HU-beta